MIKSFKDLFTEYLKNTKICPGSIINGIVISITKDIVLVDADLKSESAISIDQFYDNNGKLEVKIGDKIDVVLDMLENGFGETILSREKAKRYASWTILENAYKESLNILGIVNNKVKGGFTVELNGIRAFLPGSLVDIHPLHDNLKLEGKELEFKVIKLDHKRNNVVVSRRAVIEAENNIERDKLLKNLNEDIKIKGIVKNLTNYGAFIDLGGIDGLLHITDITWKRIKHPSEVMNIGDEIFVKILKFDREKIRISLGLKQLSDDPWIGIQKRYPKNTIFSGRVTNITDYGCFVEIEEGIEGLVHVSEMDWINKNINPYKIINVNDIVSIVILDINEEKRRISLGMKQCTANPWKKFSEIYKKGDLVEGKIKSITDFGIFVELNNGVDGLIHISDITWEVPNEKNIALKYKKGNNISSIVLQIDIERERISLGIKQLTKDPFNKYINLNKKIITSLIGKVICINNNFIIVSLDNKTQGYIKYYKNINKKYKLKINDYIKVIIINIDRKNRVINLSIIGIYIPKLENIIMNNKLLKK